MKKSICVLLTLFLSMVVILSFCECQKEYTLDDLNLDEKITPIDSNKNGKIDGNDIQPLIDKFDKFVETDYIPTLKKLGFVVDSKGNILLEPILSFSEMSSKNKDECFRVLKEHKRIRAQILVTAKRGLPESYELLKKHYDPDGELSKLIEN